MTAPAVADLVAILARGKRPGTLVLMPGPADLVPIPDDRQETRGWKVQVNGQAIDRVTTIVIENPRFGALTYGLTSKGYDSWTFRENGGGGAVLIPFVRRPEGPFIGVVRQDRPNQGGEVWNSPRGFLDPGEGYATSAARELREETGIEVSEDALIELPGAPGNPNSAFFDTSAAGRGVRFFALEVAIGELEPRDGGYVLRSRARGSSAAQLDEGISATRFAFWTEAARFGDLMTNAAVARLLAYEQTRGERGR